MVTYPYAYMTYIVLPFAGLAGAYRGGRLPTAYSNMKQSIQRVRCWFVTGLRSSYSAVNYERYVDQTVMPYVSAARNIAIATAVAVAVVLVTLLVGRLLGRFWLRRLLRTSTKNSVDCLSVTGNVGESEGHFEGHLDDRCECHMTSPVTSPSAGPLLHPCNYSETIV